MRLVTTWQCTARPVAAIFALGLLAGCGRSDAPDDDSTAIHAPEIARIMPASEALAGAHIPTLDPAPMNNAEIQKALGAGPLCKFRYTSAGDPVLAWEAPRKGGLRGVVKLNGHLVLLTRSASTGGKSVFSDGQVRLAIAPDREDPPSERQEEVDVVFEVGSSLRAGYRGYYQCAE